MDRQKPRGRYQATREEFGFIVPEDGGPDLFVPATETGGALHGDRVAYEITRDAGRRHNAEATILAVLARGVNRFTGVVGGTGRRPHLEPDHYLLPRRMRLVGPREGVEVGQRLLCRLHERGPDQPPGAMVERILGDADDPRTDVEIVRGEYGLAGAFPDEVEREAAASRPDSAPARRDFSAEPVVTIDPADARDFDDAVSLLPWRAGGWLLRVHIADVAEDVPAGGLVDLEARRRGNSTYLPGAMIPMLPETLCTESLSLAQAEQRRVITVSARVTDDGVVRSYRIDEGEVRSRLRLSYRQVQDLLEGRGGVDPEIDPMLRAMDRLAQALRARRFRHGGFELIVPEVRVDVDDRGRPARIERRLQERSHQLIEEFMILANRLACDYAVRRRAPYLFRVHPAPDPEGVETFRQEVATLAPEVRSVDVIDVAALRRWLASLPSEPRTWRIHAMFLRSFMRATYAAEDTGHFGLGLRGYGHFTSPIRRYPDLFNHRVIKWLLRHGRRPVPESWREEAPQVALACTGTEERSERAERELVRIKCIRWAQERVGSSFRAAIVAIVDRGFFVELEDLPVQGFVPREELEAIPRPRGRGVQIGSGRGGIQVGLAVIVQIARVDLRNRQILFALRAMGRRALESDPERMDPLIDPWADVEDDRGRRGRRQASTKRRGRGGSARAKRTRRREAQRREPQRRQATSGPTGGRRGGRSGRAGRGGAANRPTRPSKRARGRSRR